MKYHSKKSDSPYVVRNAYCETRDTRYAIRNTQYETRDTKEEAFSLIETVTALAILALVSSSVLVVMNRCMVSAADSVLRMQAFEVARENMEVLLASDSVEEKVEYGSSDRYPQIQWQTIVETFYEPITKRMWIQAACSAQYVDTEGQEQTIEMTHWLTDLTKEQLLQIMSEREKELAAEQIIETIEEAAEYAGLDEQTIQQWVENGMPKTEDGYYIKDWLDLYGQSDGSPTDENRRQLALSNPRLLTKADLRDAVGDQASQDSQSQSDVERLFGHTMEEFGQMSFEEVMEIIQSHF